MEERKAPQKKTCSIKNGPKYAYYYVKAAQKRPTFLLLHGFPSTADDWKNQIDDLSGAGYGVLAPDMLGYGDTDKPKDLKAYSHKKMSGEVAKILEHEGLKEVIGVGHDWGSMLLGKMWNYHPQYFKSLAFMSVPYTPPAPSNTRNIDALNTMTKAAFGYETYGYMYFFNESSAADIMSSHTASVLSLLYPDNPELHKTELCPRGKAREWVEADRKAPLPSYESQKDRKARINEFEKGGWTGPTNWYKSAIRNIDADAEAQIPASNFAIPKPVIFMGGDIDFVTRPELMAQVAGQGKQDGWLPNVEFKSVKGGSHWMMLEQPKQVLTILNDLAKRSS
ncbi:alpha/beta-hydrolase [Sporormia fimetaria CBS 119925]|uniref:Alpha/beta-hydrolase n=1 Tax=Sporormia fimetaria CBS 119925 TaxID=1340428 RepID=A0A6A6VH71_9PLEO|nr:alpha/beta-hydrolase [Sporormia fimetaria CBS 119925]